MSRFFNVSACCDPELHYMVDISGRLQEIKAMVDAEQYFTVNCARQYGKTTTLQALARLLEKDYVVVSLDFQMMSAADFQDEQEFVSAFSREILDNVEEIPKEIREELEAFAEETARKRTLSVLFKVWKAWCGQSGLRDKNQFLCNGRLNMRLILEKFVVHFHDVYGNQDEDFLEEAGRRYFLLYLKPIINGTGNYYIEAQTRNRERTDVVVDYQGEQFIVEMKIWRGDAYNTRGEEQLSGYLDYYHLEKGYMLSFCFSKKKEIGVKEIVLGKKILIEAVV